MIIYTGTYTYPQYTIGTYSTTTNDYDKIFLEIILKKEISTQSNEGTQIKMTNAEMITVSNILGKDLKECTTDEINEQLMLLRL